MRGSTRSFVIILALATILATLAAGAAFAAKGGNGHHGGGDTSGGSGGFTMVMVKDANGDHLPNFNDSVTFNVTVDPSLKPYVQLHCYQGGSLVYSQSAGFYPDFPWPGAQVFTLGPTYYWASGAADCTASLLLTSGTRSSTYSSLSFHVNA